MKWRDVLGYEGFYMASDTGLIRSVDHSVTGVFGKSTKPHTRKLRGVLRKTHWNDKTYYTVKLSKNSETKTHSVHRLIAGAFLHVDPDKRCVNHKDGNTRNNNANNLEWCTHSENNLHAYRTGLSTSGDKHHYSKLNEFQVRVIRRALDLSGSEIGRIFNVTQGAVSLIRLRKTWKYV